MTQRLFSCGPLLVLGVVLLLVLGFVGLAQAAPGDLDPSFGQDGTVTTDFGFGIDSANAVAIQTDGKIVVAGFSSNGTDHDFALARYNPDGSLGATFGNGGKVTTDFSGVDDYANALALQADGKIVVAGSSNYDFALARYLGDAVEAEPVLSVSPRALIFGKVEVGTTADKSFTVQNTGTGTLTGSATTVAPFQHCGGQLL